jgi:hypothetical protein
MPPTQITTDSIPCPICHYPIQAPTQEGQQVKCAYCDTINEAIAQVTTSTSVLIGIACFAAGVLIGPAFLISTKAGQEWLEKKVRERLSR